MLMETTEVNDLIYWESGSLYLNLKVEIDNLPYRKFLITYEWQQKLCLISK